MKGTQLKVFIQVTVTLARPGQMSSMTHRRLTKVMKQERSSQVEESAQVSKLKRRRPARRGAQMTQAHHQQAVQAMTTSHLYHRETIMKKNLSYLSKAS